MQVKLIKNKFADFIIRLLGQPDTKSMAIYPFIFYKSDYSYSVDLLAHELVHIQQAKQEGLFKWLIKYLYYLVVYGYKLNPYEKEAREKYRSNRPSAISLVIYYQSRK